MFDEDDLYDDPLRHLDDEPEDPLTVSDFLGHCNEALAYDFHDLEIIGEVDSFKVNQGKWVFFDLKDESSSVPCFIPLWNLRTELEDGMKIIVRAVPKVTAWGKFSLTIQQILPVGEGNIKKSFERLKKKLEKEGLFDPAKKRPLPSPLRHLAVITSTGAAGYADFIKILNARWGGVKIEVAHTQVQGLDAPDQIIRALKYFNEKGEADIIAIIRGGGSKDDLAVFNDETLTRAVAASRIPVITGIGHEVDESLCDLAADIRASTPSNAAEFLVPDRSAQIASLEDKISSLHSYLIHKIAAATFDERKLRDLRSFILAKITTAEQHTAEAERRIYREIVVKITTIEDKLRSKQQVLAALNPDAILSQGYAILSGKISPGETLEITTLTKLINTEIKYVKDRH